MLAHTPAGSDDAATLEGSIAEMEAIQESITRATRRAVAATEIMELEKCFIGLDENISRRVLLRQASLQYISLQVRVFVVVVVAAAVGRSEWKGVCLGCGCEWKGLVARVKARCRLRLLGRGTCLLLFVLFFSRRCFFFMEFRAGQNEAGGVSLQRHHHHWLQGAAGQEVQVQGHY